MEEILKMISFFLPACLFALLRSFFIRWLDSRCFSFPFFIRHSQSHCSRWKTIVHATLVCANERKIDRTEEWMTNWTLHKMFRRCQLSKLNSSCRLKTIRCRFGAVKLLWRTTRNFMEICTVENFANKTYTRRFDIPYSFVRNSIELMRIIKV